MTPVELRDFFAGCAMQALIAVEITSGNGMTNALEKTLAGYIAGRAYQHADAMMIEREKS